MEQEQIPQAGPVMIAASSKDDDGGSHNPETGGGGQEQVRKRTLSQILMEIGQDSSRQAVTLNDLISLLGGRGRAGLILFFAFPNVLPGPPGLSTVLGLPLFYLSLQMMLGRLPWLPRFVGERSLSRSRFAQLVGRLAPWLARAERLLRPRWPVVVSHRAEYVLGAVCLVLASVLILPIPLGNLPPALAICLIALGILERDGIWVVLGVLVGLASLVLAGGVVYALVKSAIFIVLNAFV